MAYGSGSRLGETVRPELMMADFSGFERAGQSIGNALANTGAQIGDIIKTNKEIERETKQAEQMAKSIRNAIPDLAPMADDVLGQLNNPDMTANQKLAVARSIKDSLNIGIMGLQEKRAQEEFNMRRAAASASASNRAMAEKEKIAEEKNMIESMPSQLALLRASGFQNQADILEQQFNQSLKSGNMDNASRLAGQVFGFAAQLKPTTLQPLEKEAPISEIASSVSNALNLATAGGVEIPGSILQSFNTVVNQKDSKAAKQIADSLTSTINDQIKIQREENKELVNLEDGTQVLMGEKTGKRYTQGGIPIPTTDPSYQVKVEKTETSLEQRAAMLKLARSLFESGKKGEALDLVNAVGTGGLFGKTATMADLEDQFGDSGTNNNESEEDRASRIIKEGRNLK